MPVAIYESTYLYSYIYIAHLSHMHKTDMLALFSLCLYTFTCHTHHNRSVSPSYHHIYIYIMPLKLVFIVIISSLSDFVGYRPAPSACMHVEVINHVEMIATGKVGR